MEFINVESYKEHPTHIIYENVKTNEYIKIYNNLNNIMDYNYLINGKPYRKSVFMNRETGFIENTFNKDDEKILIDNNYLYHTKEIININNTNCGIKNPIEHLTIEDKVMIAINNSIIVKTIYNNHTEYEIYNAEITSFNSSHIHLLQNTVIVYKNYIMHTEFVYEGTKNTIYMFDRPNEPYETLEIKFNTENNKDLKNNIPNFYYKHILPEFCSFTTNKFMRMVPKTLFQLEHCLHTGLCHTDELYEIMIA